MMFRYGLVPEMRAAPCMAQGFKNSHKNICDLQIWVYIESPLCVFGFGLFGFFCFFFF